MTAPPQGAECADLRARAAGLASLGPTDPERVAAELHASSCPACAAALREGGTLWRLVDQSAASLEAPPSDVLERIRSVILADLAPRGAAWHGLIVALCLAAGFAAILVLAKDLTSALGPFVEAGVVLALGFAGAAFLARDGLAKVGFIVALTASAGFAVFAGQGGSELFGVYGLRCLGMEIFASALPLAAVVLLAARGKRRGTAGELASAGALGALAGQAALHLTCRAQMELPHLLVTHTGGVVVAALLGAALSRLRFSRALAANS